MKHSYKKQILALSLLCGASAAMAADALEEPNIVTIPLPKAQSMQFSLLKVSEDANIFSSFEFNMGEASDADFPVKAAPTTVAGTVFVNNSYWALPMGCTEVTKGQYAAIMTPDKMPSKEEENLPQTNITKLEMLQFIEKLNVWLQTDSAAKAAVDKIGSSQKHGTPFVTLPHEAEWEFAARGGLAVPESQFADAIPYDDEEELMRCENVAAQKNAKVKAVMSTKKCNPAGLYDMFGNVEEMVQDSFRAEYAFGRTGGDVVRGACFTTKIEDATSFRRREIPLFDEKDAKTPYKKPLIGFRLSMGAAVFTDAVLGTIEEDWKAYDAKRIVINPNDSATDSTTDKLNKDEKRLAKQLELIAARLDKDPANAKALAQIELLKSHTDEMQKKIDAADIKTAKAGLVLLYNASYSTLKLSVEKNVYEASLAAGVKDANFISIVAKDKNGIEADKRDFQTGCETLMMVKPELVNSSLENRRNEIASKVGETGQQTRLFEIAMEMYKKAYSSGAVSEQMLKEWADSIDALAKQSLAERNAAPSSSSSAVQTTTPRKTGSSKSGRKGR